MFRHQTESRPKWEIFSFGRVSRVRHWYSYSLVSSEKYHLDFRKWNRSKEKSTRDRFVSNELVFDSSLRRSTTVVKKVVKHMANAKPLFRSSPCEGAYTYFTDCPAKESSPASCYPAAAWSAIVTLFGSNSWTYMQRKGSWGSSKPQGQQFERRSV